MKKKLTCLLLALMLIATLTGVASAEAPVTLHNTQNSRVQLSDSSVAFIMDGVYDDFAFSEYHVGNGRIVPRYSFFFEPTATITMLQDTPVSTARYEFLGTQPTYNFGTVITLTAPLEVVDATVCPPLEGFAENFSLILPQTDYVTGTIYSQVVPYSERPAEATAIYEFVAVSEPVVPEIYTDLSFSIRSLAALRTELISVQQVPASATDSRVLVNGEHMQFAAYNIYNSNYFMLRDIAYVLNGTEKQFSVDYDEQTKAIIIETGSSYTPAGKEMMSRTFDFDVTAQLTQSPVFVNKRAAYVTVYNIGGANYFKLRDLAALADFGVVWNETTNTISIDTGHGYSA